MTRVLVAACARWISARTAGITLLQILFAATDPWSSQDRVLDGPTSDVWIDPWHSYLASAGVTFELGATLAGFDLDAAGARARIASARISTATGAQQAVTADHYVAALPCERLAAVLDSAVVAAAPSLAGVSSLTTGWMNGVVFYLAHDVPMVHGHTLYLGSQWALTSISQHQFCSGVDLSRYGTGNVGGVLSVDVSDWDAPGPLSGRPACECSPAEIRDEVWAQSGQPMAAPRFLASRAWRSTRRPTASGGSGPTWPHSSPGQATSLT